VQNLRDALVRTGLDLSDPEKAGRTVDAMLLLASRSVPITPASLAAATAAASPPALGRMLGDLLDLVRALSRGLRPPAASDLRALEQALAGLLVSAPSPEDLRRLLSEMGLGLEGKLKDLAGHPQEDLDRLAQTDLKASLLRLQAALKDPARLADAEDSALLETLNGRVGQALHHLERLQILNLPAQNDPNAHLFLQIPLLFGQERTSADLRVFYAEKEGRRHIDPENVRLVLSLDLAHLGRVEVDLRVVDRIVDCRIDVEGEAQRGLFSEAQGDLKTGLEGCGYTVRKVACEVRTAASEAGPREEEQAKIGLDVRV
jgi:hypothetical protein